MVTRKNEPPSRQNTASPSSGSWRSRVARMPTTCWCFPGRRARPEPRLARGDGHPPEGTEDPPDLFELVFIAVYERDGTNHRCPEPGTSPKANSAWWDRKLNDNVARDRRCDARLSADGWRVLRIWEHEAPEAAAVRIQLAVLSRKRQ
jgi:hypothetical protein